MLWCFWLLGLSAGRSRGAGRLDGIDWNERHGKQLADRLDIVGVGLTGEEAVVADEADGKTCIRKRRMNSLVSSVITLLYPWRRQGDNPST